MIRPDASLLSLMSLRLAAAALFSIGCSPSSEAPVHTNGGSPSHTGGNSSGFTGGTTGFTGGTSSGFTGGATGFTGGATGFTGGAKGTGGATGTTTGGVSTTTTGGVSTTTTGGVSTTTTGGVATGTGGAATATGGSGGSSACNTYNGTLAATGASKIFADGFGASTTGMWKGYAYTYTYGTGAVIKPNTSTMECFKGAALCAAGTVPALDSAGVGVGWNIAQAAGTSTTGTAVITTVKFMLMGAKAGMRVSLGGMATGDEYCYTLTDADATAANSAAGMTRAAADFKKECYDTAKATAYAGSMIKSIQVGAPGSMAAAQTFDFCVVDIEPG